MDRHSGLQTVEGVREQCEDLDQGLSGCMPVVLATAIALWDSQC